MSTPKNRQNRKRALPSPHAYAFTISDGQSMGLPGRTTIWKMIRAGTLEAIDVGGRKMLTGASVRRVLGVKEPEAAAA